MSKLSMDGVTKSFKGNKAADKISCTFESGKVYALLGRNGAGKTTLMRLLTTQYIPEEGTVTYNGEAVFENEDALTKICMFTEDIKGFVGMKLDKIFNMARVFYKDWDEEYCKYLIEVFELDIKKRYSDLSKGQKTSVAIVLGLASKCEFTIFDEIYSGLDAVARAKFYELLIEEYSEKRTFILSTHLIDEMSNLFSDVVIIDKGSVILEEEIEDLKNSVISLRASKELESKITEGQILTKSEFSNVTTWIVKGMFDQRKIEAYQQVGFEVGALSLQEIFVALINKNGRA